MGMVILGLIILESLFQIGQGAQISDIACPINGYKYNERCHPCPHNCNLCVSDKNCTQCKIGFYGPACENPCGDGCPDECHKVYGHCTYSCPDGKFPYLENKTCQPCPKQCPICTSLTECVVCKNGTLVETCRHSCPRYCNRCDKSTARCLQCQDSYFLHEGQCKNCPYGCTLCKETDSCQSCKNGFLGPINDRCILKCPGNTSETYDVPDKDGRCGIWQDTNINICKGESESYRCETTGYCLESVPCPAGSRCFISPYKKTTCVTILQYECVHKCNKFKAIQRCKRLCSIRDEDDRDTRIRCLNAGFVYIFTNIYQKTDALCSQSHVRTSKDVPKSSPGYSHTKHDSIETSSRILGIVLIVFSVCMFIIIVWNFCRCEYRLSRTVFNRRTYHLVQNTRN